MKYAFTFILCLIATPVLAQFPDATRRGGSFPNSSRSNPYGPVAGIYSRPYSYWYKRQPNYFLYPEEYKRSSDFPFGNDKSKGTSKNSNRGFWWADQKTLYAPRGY